MERADGTRSLKQWLLKSREIFAMKQILAALLNRSAPGSAPR
jgi:hypothetical protein